MRLPFDLKKVRKDKKEIQMSNLIPFQFEGRAIRVVTDDSGEPLFVGRDICEALGYVDATTAIRNHCKGVQKQRPLQTAGGLQEMRVLSEPDVLRLIVNCTLPAAQAFERLVFEEILPSIRKTGGYQVKSAKVGNGKGGANRLTDARAIDFIGNMVAKVPGVRAEVVAAIKLNMMEECIGIPVTQFRIALPSTPIEKMVRLNPTQIGERIGSKSNIKISAQRVNQCLLLLGLQRKSESGWVITEIGAKYGESRPFQASNKHVGDQIDWHESIIEVVESELAKAPLSVVKLSVATQSAQGALV